jgi:type I restriction enzyme S subunit
MASPDAMLLSDVTEIVMGQSPPGDSYNDAGRGLPFFQGKAEFGEVSPTVVKWCTDPKRVARNGDILLSVRAPVGPTNVASAECCIGRGLAAIRANPEKLVSGYLRYFLRHSEPRLARMGQGSTFSSIGRKEIAGLRIPLPKLEDQRRIVDLLSRAENIVRMRREAEQKAKEIIPALFLDMFGDPARNEMGWKRRPLGEIVRSIDSGKSPRCDERTRGPGEWGVLKLGAVTWGRYDESEHKVLPPDIRPFSASEVRAGDLLISRKNTLELVGASAYVWETDGRILLPDLIFRLCIDGADIVNPIYLWALLSTDAKRNQLRNMASGAAASMPNISKGRLAMLSIELPAIGAQRTFADRVRRAHELEAQQVRAVAYSNLVFQSLLAGTFPDGLAT